MYPPEINPPSNYIDPNSLLSQYSISELNNFAEEYFSKIDEIDFLLAKPFVWTGGVPSLLGNFNSLIHSLELFVGSRILDFAAGTCWTSRYLAQMGGEVLASDVSESALKLGKDLLSKHPLIGNFGSLNFKLTSEVLSNSIYKNYFDRIVILDAFHHFPNYSEKLTQFFEMLIPGGILAMSEPGRWHSRTEAAQSEMKHHRVLERDFDVIEIGNLAESVGFDRIEVGIFSPIPAFVPYQLYYPTLTDNKDYLATQIRNYMSNHTLVKLVKPGQETIDSRRTQELHATWIFEGIRGIKVANSGKSLWLPSGESIGSVNVGITRVNKDGTLGTLGEWRIPLSTKKVEPGEVIEVKISEDLLAKLPDKFELDLYSTKIAWFKVLGNKPLSVSK